ncbi:MAG TPA: DUF58 domain-containing protein [Acidimicrobiales bacterium]|jgi:uncharacterized protein (DUF58 family)
MTPGSAPSPGAPAGRAAPSAADVVRRFELTLSRRIDGLLQGDHAGRVLGLGSENGESRRYLPGDDPRRMDWNVTARAREPYVRDAVADREVETWLVVDLSASTYFGTARCTKRDLVVLAAGAMAMLAARSGNRVGAHLLTSAGIVTVPARSGHPHVMALVRQLVSAPLTDGAGPPLTEPLARLARPKGRRGLAVVISDFPGEPGWAHAMRLVAARHETLAVEVLDPRELDIPDVGMLVVVDPETGREREVQTGDAGMRRRYAELSRARRHATAAALRASGVDHVVLRTDRDATADLVRWLAQRPHRLAHRRRAQGLAGAGGARAGAGARP